MSHLRLRLGSLVKGRMPLWYGWVAIFYVFWLALVLSQDLISVVSSNWQIAFSMLIGSYAAGSTPMGGGTVGFPVLVMLMDMPANLGRDFSFAIQSIGMTSASIFIYCRRQKIDADILKGAFYGAIIGTPMGLLFIAPYVDALIMKLIFSVLWAGFGVVHVLRIKEVSSNDCNSDHMKELKTKMGFWAAWFSTATLCSVTGVGVDMVIYSILVLLFRSDLKIAVPTSVIIMAYTSVIGVFVKAGAGTFEPGVYAKWLAASPVVILGAPLGVLAVELIGRKITLFIVATLCIAQFIWLCVVEYETLSIYGVVLSLVFVVFVIFILESLRRIGHEWSRAEAPIGNNMDFSTFNQKTVGD